MCVRLCVYVCVCVCKQVRGHNLTHALQKSGLGLATGHTVRGTAKVDTLSHVLKVCVCMCHAHETHVRPDCKTHSLK